jgi:hypothetical protein
MRVNFIARGVPTKLENYFPKTVQNSRCSKGLGKKQSRQSIQGRKSFANCNETFIFNLQVSLSGNFPVRPARINVGFEFKADANAPA